VSRDTLGPICPGSKVSRNFRLSNPSPLRHCPQPCQSRMPALYIYRSDHILNPLSRVATNRAGRTDKIWYQSGSDWHQMLWAMLNYAGKACKAGNGCTALQQQRQRLRRWEQLHNCGGGALTGVRVSIDGMIKVLSTCCGITLQTRALDITNTNDA